MRPAKRSVARALASAFLAGAWNREGLLERARFLFSREGAEGRDASASGVEEAFAGEEDENDGDPLERLAEEVLSAFPSAPRAHREALALFILRSAAFGRTRTEPGRTPLRHLLVDRPRMGHSRFPVPPLETLGDLAGFLGLDDAQLSWFADRRGYLLRRGEGPLHHYTYRWVPTATGGARLLEAPKQRLRALQRRILDEILARVPPHDAAQGFRAGRSALTHARLHARMGCVVRFDLRAFFAHVRGARVVAVFDALGYPDQVARTLAALCTHRTPLPVIARAPALRSAEEVAARFLLRQALAEPHLPQGAPTSPALANLCARALDLRLSGVARVFGVTYSRYADDLTFSGAAPLARGAGRLRKRVEAIARAEGFRVNDAKTRVMPAFRQQRVAGLVVNEGVNLARADYDRLKATLTNCVRHGPASQVRGRADFQAHLLGRVSWAEYVSPHRGEKLRRLFAQIRWD